MEKTIEKLNLVNLSNRLYLGVDTHKDQHAIVGLDYFSQLLYEKEINNTKEDFDQLIKEVENY